MMEHPDRWCTPFWRVAANDNRKPPPSLLWPAIAAAAGLAFVFGVALWPVRAHGAGVQFDCHTLAVAMGGMADFRDTGADLEKVVRMARRRHPNSGSAQVAVIEREIRRLWAERLPGDLAARRLFERCRAQLGDMGRDG